MKKILVFRTASDRIVWNLLDDLIHGQDNDVYCFIPQSISQVYFTKYPNIKYVLINSNRFNNVRLYKNVPNIRFDEIYFTATRSFKSYSNIIEIANNIKAKKWLFYNKDGMIEEIKIKNPIERYCKYLVEIVCLFFFKMIYRVKSLGRNN